MEGPSTDSISTALDTLQTQLRAYEDARADFLDAQAKADEAQKKVVIKQSAANDAWLNFFEAEKSFRKVMDTYKGQDGV